MNFTRLAEISCVLVDNGSVNPGSTLNLHRIAGKLGTRIGHRVEPVSLLHSDKVPATDLDGVPPQTLGPFIERTIAAGTRHFVVLPFFLGPSAALTEFIPEQMAKFAETTPDLDFELASPLVRMDQLEDNRIARILAENVRSTIANKGLVRPPAVVLVDHGSPKPAVTAVRDHVAAQLATELGSEAQLVLAASMERRDGAQYDFNEPLLDRALRRPPLGAGGGDVIVALMFLSPGRHAGEGGDVAQICSIAEKECPGLNIHRTEPIGKAPLVIDILADRFRETTQH